MNTLTNRIKLIFCRFIPVSFGGLFAGLIACLFFFSCHSATKGQNNVQKINNIVVPPEPDPVKNRATIPGVDSDANGVRDDIDRLNASQFGADPVQYNAAKQYAGSLQTVLVSNDAPSASQNLDLIRCETDAQLLDVLDQVTKSTLDISERQAIYDDLFAGAVISDEGCPGSSSNPLVYKNSFSSTENFGGANAYEKTAGDRAAIVDIHPVFYVNGIQNTIPEMQAARQKIQSILDNSPNHANKRRFHVTGIYNPIGFSGRVQKHTPLNLAEDLIELYLLKTAEEHYAADLAKIVHPHNQATPAIDRIAAQNVAAYANVMAPGANYLETFQGIDDSIMQNTKRTVTSLTGVVISKGKAIVIAHSQGNLLANLAYAKLAATYGNQTAGMIRVVNVANTSEFAVSSLNLTHAGDAALYSAATPLLAPEVNLETLPANGHDWPRTTPYCPNYQACNFTLTAPTFDAPGSAIPNQSLIDLVLNHSLVETYLSTATVPILDPQGVSFTPGADRFQDRFEDLVYAAAISLFPVSSPSLIGIRMNAPIATEEFGLVDTGTGSFTAQGAVGDLAVWSMASAIANNTLYVIGANSANIWKLYAMDIATGQLLRSPAMAETGFTFAGGIQNTLFALRYNRNASREEFGVIDPVTGNFTVRGVVGDLAFWNSQALVDETTGTLYVIGVNNSNVWKLYALNINSGQLVNAIQVPQAYYLSGKNANGEAIAIRQNTVSLQFEFGLLNLLNGSFTASGPIGDMTAWSMQSTVSDAVLYVSGANSLGQWKLYTLDTVSGQLTNSVVWSVSGVYLTR